MSRARCFAVLRRRCGSPRASSRVTLPFPSREWVGAYGAAINASESYRTASTQWTHGAVALVVNRQPEIGIAEPVGIWLDLDRGTCRAAKLVSQTEAEQDRKSTRLNSSHRTISYAVFCLKKKKNKTTTSI